MGLCKRLHRPKTQEERWDKKLLIIISFSDRVFYGILLRFGLVSLAWMGVFTTNRIDAQVSTSNNLKWVDSLILRIKSDQQMDSERKSGLADSAYHITVRERAICRQIELLDVQASHLDKMGLADSALTQLYRANSLFQKGCDSFLVMSIYRNMTSSLLSMNDFEKVDSISRVALKFWNHKWKEKDPRFAILTNQAIAHINNDKLDEATALFRQVYQEAVEAKNQDYILKELINLGGIKGMTGDLDSAFYFFSLAASIAKEKSDATNYMSLLINIANVQGERGKFRHAISILDSAFVMAEKRKSTETLMNVEYARSDLYMMMGNYELAYKYMKNYRELRDEFLNEESIKAVTEMMEKYESEKKARQIQQLEIDNLDATLTNERITNARNRYLIVGAGVLLMAIGLYSRLRYVHKARVAIQKEKDISEKLLLNILPSSVADELKEKGYTEAKHFDPVTILFSDFKNFTVISQEFTPDELVGELNACFQAFDEIMTTYGLEKIKTIGDAYMAAGNIPHADTTKATEVIHAALDMQKFINLRKSERNAKQLPAFEMRIGIHSGPVVAGVVGLKKFQYDIWGDTVNIASRMETNGEIGKVNISEATYNLVHTNPFFTFIPRGMIEAKGKGEMPMYFVDRIETISPTLN